MSSYAEFVHRDFRLVGVRSLSSDCDVLEGHSIRHCFSTLYDFIGVP